MRNFLALYRGQDIETSELIAVSADPRLIRNFALGMVEDDPGDEPEDGHDHRPPVNGNGPPRRRPATRE